MNKLLSSPAWQRALVALVLVWAGLLWMHRATALAMMAIWDSSETYAHAWVVPPIALWLVWRMRARVLAIRPQAAFGPLLLVALASFLWLLGELVAVNTATQFALVALLVLAVPAVLGWKVGRALAFPLGFLFFAVPAGDFLTPYLMTWTADATIAALRLSGIPVYREGLQFVIPSGSWSVVEACSGIRYLLASLMVGTLYAYLNYQSTRRRLLFVLISILVPIVANWMRAYMIVMLGHLSGNEIAVGADHLLYGWVFFGVVIMLLYWLGARWAEPAPASTHPPVALGSWPMGPGMASSLLVLALALGPLQLMARFELGTSGALLPLQADGDWGSDWRVRDDPVPAWQPVYGGPAMTMRTGLEGSDGTWVGVHVAYYRDQNAQSKLISTSNRLLADDGYGGNALALKARKVVSPGGEMAVREAHLPAVTRRADTARPGLLVWRVYWIDGQWVASDIKGKLLAAWGRLLGRGDDSAAILIFADNSNPKAAEASLARFVATGLPVLVKRLEAARAAGAP